MQILPGLAAIVNIFGSKKYSYIKIIALITTSIHKSTSVLLYLALYRWSQLPLHQPRSFMILVFDVIAHIDLQEAEPALLFSFAFTNGGM